LTMRWFIIRTLLYKEYLRYRYNWGLLVVVAALLALSGLVAVGDRMHRLPGQAAAALRVCMIFHDGGPRAQEWVRHLQEHPPTFEHDVRFDARWPNFIRLAPDYMAITLEAPTNGSASAAEEAWKAHYWHSDEAASGVMPYRDWLARETRAFLGARPRFEEDAKQSGVMPGGEPLERVPLIVTALAIFALYLLSFNLYITSTGEEREKRQLLGLLLSPASPLEVIVAKAIFYAVSSLAVSAAVIAMYRPALLGNLYIWLTIVSGSVGYVAIGTVVISIVRRQTTISTISMLYLISTSIIMFLSQFLPPFGLLKYFLMEDYLYRQMKQLIAGEPTYWLKYNQAALTVTVIVWAVIAVYIFAKQGMAISRSR
jgi:hypothetical protein